MPCGGGSGKFACELRSHVVHRDSFSFCVIRDYFPKFRIIVYVVVLVVIHQLLFVVKKSALSE